MTKPIRTASTRTTALAAALSVLTCVLHVVGGGPQFHPPALDSPSPPAWKVAFSVIWHEVSAMLLFNGVALIAADLAARRNALLLWLVLLLNMAFGGLFAGYGFAKLGTPLVLLQWVLFAGIVGGAVAVPEVGRGVDEGVGA